MVSDLENEEVIAVIHDAIGWAANKNIERLYAIVAQDDQFFIYHPDSHSTIRGFDSFKKMEATWMDNRFQATGYAVHDLALNFSQQGDTAWYACMLDDHAEWNGKPCGWDNCRWTGILEKRDGRWVIVQMHFSFAFDG